MHAFSSILEKPRRYVAEDKCNINNTMQGRERTGYVAVGRTSALNADTTTRKGRAERATATDARTKENALPTRKKNPTLLDGVI